MSVNEDIYDALSPIEGVDEVFDSKRPDNYLLTGAVLVFSSVSDVPEVPIDGAIIGEDQLWQVSVYAKDVITARTVKALVIGALHAVEGDTIERCDFAAAHGELYDADSREYHVPIDFDIRTRA